MSDLAIIQRKIYEIRGQRVILDRDLAALYQVETRVLNQAVKRNIERFPDDFMFQLTKEEVEFLKSQIVILETDENMSSQIVMTSNENLKSQIVTSSEKVISHWRNSKHKSAKQNLVAELAMMSLLTKNI